MLARYIGAGHLFRIAKDAYNRIPRDAVERAPEYPDALVALVFSAIAAEAFINEIAEAAENPMLPLLPEASPNPPSVQALANMLDELERSRGSTRLRFMAARFALIGSAYPRGAQPYQDFDLLTRCRDAIVHRKSEFQQFGEDHEPLRPSLIREFHDRGLTGETGGAFMDWLTALETRAVARWACNAASAMIRSVLDVIPVSPFRNEIELMYTPALRLFDAVD